MPKRRRKRDSETLRATQHTLTIRFAGEHMPVEVTLVGEQAVRNFKRTFKIHPPPKRKRRRRKGS